MKLGIVGLPNVGKSTLFNSLTKAGAESANYPSVPLTRMWELLLCRMKDLHCLVIFIIPRK